MTPPLADPAAAPSVPPPSDLLLARVIHALQDIKGKDIETLSVSRLTALFDTVVLVSAESTRQTRALARHLVDEMRRYGHPVIGMEGQHSGEWILVDLGAVIIHIMQPATRAYYDLTSLWLTPGGLHKIHDGPRPPSL